MRVTKAPLSLLSSTRLDHARDSNATPRSDLHYEPQERRARYGCGSTLLWALFVFKSMALILAVSSAMQLVDSSSMDNQRRTSMLESIISSPTSRQATAAATAISSPAAFGTYVAFSDQDPTASAAPSYCQTTPGEDDAVEGNHFGLRLLLRLARAVEGWQQQE